MVKVYIAGPMTGLPEVNKPAFFAKEAELKQEGKTVLNPAILPDGMSWEEYMHICIPMVQVADEIYMLRGWESSRGAVWEHQEAMATGKSVIYEC
ncbi:hypothetical protein VA249_29820 [Vibrio alfacsensis]|uniref:DUF4406 domain-containing protein n=1 Tax=Vibrio alfacsensis TaxID=1074311 RepID=UPI001BF0A385|nr:DUF4406 domain-containing protein [Vibrio alfacsensis]BBM66336.1 hypothetical protein VA249_29820 [Vibrio alfacsensis]